MALLTNAKRQKNADEFQQKLSRERDATNSLDGTKISKTDCRTLANVCDDFLEGEKTNFVQNYLNPAGLKGKFTAKQIALALLQAVNERFIKGS